MACLHMVCGATGAGKTTFAKQLAGSEKALVFSIDDWMVTLFGPDQPAKPDFVWMMERVRRAHSQICQQVQALAALEIDSVLDLGFTKRTNRDDFREFASKHGLTTRLHFVDVDPEIRWQRVQQRNESKSGTYSLTVTRPMFNFIETLWEPPTTDEMPLCVPQTKGQDLR